MNVYKITLHVLITDTNYEEIAGDFSKLEVTSKLGSITSIFNFIPQVGMHLGENQLVTVCQVNWRGGNELDVYSDCIECVHYLHHHADPILFIIKRCHKNLDELITRIEEIVPIGENSSDWKWGPAEDDECDIAVVNMSPVFPENR